MRTVNLKEEVKKVRIAQEEANANLQEVIDAVEYQVKADNQLLHALKTMQNPLDTIMSNEEDVEEKVRALKSLKEYFLILREILELVWEHHNDYGSKYDLYDDSMCKLLNLDILNVFDENTAKDYKLAYYDSTKEAVEEISKNPDVKWVDEI